MNNSNVPNTAKKVKDPIEKGDLVKFTDYAKTQMPSKADNKVREVKAKNGNMLLLDDDQYLNEGWFEIVKAEDCA